MHGNNKVFTFLFSFFSCEKNIFRKYSFLLHLQHYKVQLNPVLIRSYRIICYTEAAMVETSPSGSQFHIHRIYYYLTILSEIFYQSLKRGLLFLNQIPL